MNGTENPFSTNSVNAWMDDPATVDIVRQMQEDFTWAMEHYRELEQQYPGEYVVVWQKQVIAHGIDEEELLRQAATAERPREQLVVVELPTFFESPRGPVSPWTTEMHR